MASSFQIGKLDRPELAKHDPSILDLAFVMDCTSSMGLYIHSALENIRSIVEEIVVSEKSDIHLALVEYRDHPPQDCTFVTRMHDFTAKVNEMKDWLEACQAFGGGDTPEAVADGLHATLKLSWRTESTKICILIADAPPHGLVQIDDGFPNGCPDGLDPVVIVREMAKKSITLYTVGVEPPIVPYREFFMSLAYITGGQYVPMVNAKLLAKVIIGGVREEISLDRLMQDAQADINREMQRAEAEGVDEKEKIKRMQNLFATKNLCSTQMSNPFGAMTSATTDHYSKCATFGEMRGIFVPQPAVTSNLFSFGTPTAAPTFSLFGSSTTTSDTVSFATPTAGPATSLFGAPVAVPTTSLFGAPVAVPTTSLFGAPVAARTTSLFGPPTTVPTTSLFGPPTTAPTTSLFGPPTTGPTTSLFAPPTTAPTTSLFGPPTTAPTTSLFGPSTTAPTTSLFGPPTTATLATPTAIWSGFSFAAPNAHRTSSSAFVSSVTSTEPTYEIAENQVVNEDQAARLYQKWQNRNK